MIHIYSTFFNMYTHQGTMLIFTAAHYRLMSKTTILFILHGVIYIRLYVRKFQRVKNIAMPSETISKSHDHTQ